MTGLAKQQHLTKECILSISSTLSEINKITEKWKILPTGNDQNEAEKGFDLQKFEKIFASFGSNIDPENEDVTEFSYLLDLRDQVNESKKKLAFLQANKATVGPEEVLKEAINLRMLIPKLRSSEIEFVYKFIEKWKKAITTMCNDLNAASGN